MSSPWVVVVACWRVLGLLVVDGRCAVGFMPWWVGDEWAMGRSCVLAGVHFERLLLLPNDRCNHEVVIMRLNCLVGVELES